MKTMRKNSVTLALLSLGVFVLPVLLSLAVPVAQAKPADTRLQEGLYAEEIEGDLGAAIKIYEQIINDKSAEDTYVARAMYRLGLCHVKKNDEKQAKAVFQKLIAQFPQQAAIIEKAQPLLDSMSNPDPADLMPPETKIYVELGSPGRQIEKILNMLKGTPFENPLAAIGGGGKNWPGGKSPGDMMAALLNPSMMTEFKKIRGMAVGLMTVPINVSNPPVVAVLYPGESDALRGILIAALGMAFQPGETIEGMQTLRMGDGGGAAYDDEVIIIAQPLEQLIWSVKQYKAVTQKPTLASKNKQFSKLRRESRQDNAITVWLDGAGIFGAIREQMAKGGQAAQLRLMDGVADFNSIEQITTQLSVQEKGVIVKINVGLKEGHQCLAYGLIRTPNLARRGFDAVPSDAAALVSFALSEPDAAGRDNAQRIIRKLTGLDIGREVFANIEQITLFAAPPKPSQPETGGSRQADPLSCLGMTITSHDSERTCQLLNKLFAVADLVLDTAKDNQPSEETKPPEGKYYVGSFNNEDIHCHIEQVGDRTVLALRPDMLEACRSALNRKKSALNSGPLKTHLGKLPADASKLVLVNIGGAIRIADAFVNWLFDNPRNAVHRQLAQLAQAFDNTTLQVRTGEQPNNFNVRVGIEQVPPLGAVLPMLMQLSQADFQAKARATEPKPADGAVVGAGAKVELKWTAGANAATHRVYFGANIDELSLLDEVQNNSYDKLPAPEKGVTYYWRIDEVQPDGSVIAGDVWSFSTGKLVGWWKFDETSGEKVADSSGNGEHGTVVEGKPVWNADGKFGGCLDFDETYGVSIPKEVFGTVSNGITISVWVYGNQEQKKHSDVILQAGAGDTGKPYIVSIYTDWLDYGLKFATGLGEPDTLKFNPGAPEDWAGRWNHYAFVKDADNGSMKIYLNGNLATEKTGATAPMSGVGAARIGIAPDRFGDQYIGKLDDLRIYNYALSEQEIAALCPTPSASSPRPANRAVVSPTGELKLSWKPGTNATSHKIYGGTSPDKLSLLAEVTDPSYDGLGELQKDATYYWRVDEVQADGSVVTGDVWSFSAGKLVGWWEFDETSGEKVADSSGNGYHGTVVKGGEPVWNADGKFGGCLDFDETYGVSIPKEVFGTVSNGITISVWVYGNQEQKKHSDVILQAGAGDTGKPYIVSIYTDWLDYGLKFATGLGEPDTLKFNPGAPEDWAGRWNHYAFVKDADNGSMKIYLNGNLATEKTGATAPMSGVGAARIGIAPDRFGDQYIGRLDDFRIYNYELSSEEIAAIFESAPSDSEKD